MKMRSKVEVKRLTNKIIIPTDNNEGINASLAEHFGRAPYFTVVEFDSKGEVTNINTVTNVSEHVGGTGSPHDHLTKLQPTAIVVHGMGPRGITAFQSAGIEVLRANANTVKEVVEAYKQGKLEELTEGCPNAAHHNHDEHHHH
jgi:predicted Fe-Mo cluster-binding NifX family protein